MHIFFIFITCVASALFGTEKLRIYDEREGDKPLSATSIYAEISSALEKIGVRFEKWEACQPLPSSAQEADVFIAYRRDIERLKMEGGYQTVDIVRIFPDSPKKGELRSKFLSEHTHTEDEVRFFVEGSALFYLHTQGKVFIVLCEQGDLISIPANYPHWFDMGDAPYFTAIRFFTDPAGWVANFTGTEISKRFSLFEPSQNCAGGR